MERMEVAMSAVQEELERACRESAAFPETTLPFPDADVLASALLHAEVDYTSDLFLSQLHSIVSELLAWPSAWPDVQTLLARGRPWTRAYCERALPFAQEKLFFMNIRPVYPLLRNSLAELRLNNPEGADAVERWFAALRTNGTARTQQLLSKFLEQDAMNSASRVMVLLPLEHLLQHLLAEVAAHFLLDVGAGSAGVRAILNGADPVGRNVLHLAALQGNTPMVETLLHAKPPEERAAYAAILDDDGYSAEDWARLGGFSATAAKLSEMGARSQAPATPVDLFPVPRATGPACSRGHGGWNASGAELVPPHWLLPSESLYEVDSISASQFDWDVFERHYLRHRRPLLVRGGALPADPRYAREELLEAAGDRTVRAFDLPYADQLRGAEAVEMTLREYSDFLRQRVRSDPSKNLSYVFVVLPEDERPLRFATVLPRLLRDKVRLRTTQFSIGGVFMGSPMHHHVHAVNSLAFGRKLWLFKPPAQQEFRKTVMYHDLLSSSGAPGVARCVQEAGDLLYVPSGWIHGALCLCDCVSVAHEFSSLEPEFDDCDLSDLEAER